MRISIASTTLTFYLLNFLYSSKFGEIIYMLVLISSGWIYFEKTISRLNYHNNLLHIFTIQKWIILYPKMTWQKIYNHNHKKVCLIKKKSESSVYLHPTLFLLHNFCLFFFFKFYFSYPILFQCLSHSTIFIIPTFSFLTL